LDKHSLKIGSGKDVGKKKSYQHQQIVKSWFDTSSFSEINFNVADLVLKWGKAHENKGEHTKFQNLWLGPFVISEKLGPSSFRLHNLEGQPDTFLVNGQSMKKYFTLENQTHPLVNILIYIFFFGSFHFVWFFMFYGRLCLNHQCII